MVIPSLKVGEGHELANPLLEPGGGGQRKPERHAGWAVPGYQGLAPAAVLCREIREGFDAPRNAGEHPPCHVDSLRHSLKQTAVAQFDEAFTRCRARWMKASFIKRRGTSTMNSTKILVDGDYEGAGQMTVIEETVDEQGKRHRRKVVTKEFSDPVIKIQSSRGL